MNQYEKCLRKYLMDACQASYVPTIEKARENVLSLPSKWVIHNIHSIATEILNLSDDWEYRRLLELYQMLDKKLFRHLIDIGLESKEDGIREAANDFGENY